MPSPSEHDPLIKKKESGIRFWWTHVATHQYKFAVTYATRVALWTVLISTIPLMFPKGRKFFHEHGFSVAYIVCNFLFTIGPNVGTTMSNSVQGLIGNLWASGMLIVLHGIFPGGYQGDNPVAFWVGLSGSLLFIFAFMYLNVNANVQFFALYGYVGYAMTFLDPNNSSRVSEAFTLDHQGVAVNAVILFAIGAVLAILCSLLPWPVTARSLMLMKAEAALELTFSLYRQIVEYYVGSSASMQIVELMSNVKKIRSDLDEASDAIGAAWWGCFGLGSRERSRQCVGQLVESLEKILTHIEPLMAVVSREGFEPRHTQLTSQIRSELLDVVNKTEALFKFAFETTRDGVLAPNEKAIMENDLAELDASVNNLFQKMRQVERQINAQKT